MSLLEARDVSKRVGRREILSGVNLRLDPGRIIALFGPNGAGKSTLLKVFALLLKPSSGTIIWRERPVRGNEAALRREVGVVAHATYLYNNLSASENLHFYGRLFGVRDLRNRIGEVLDQVGLGYCAHDQVGTFSRGMQQRLSLGRALLHRPRLLLLDEPFTGLDREGGERLLGILDGFRNQDGACLLISHDLDESLSLADGFVILVRGRVARRGECAGLATGEFTRLYQEAAGAPPAPAVMR